MAVNARLFSPPFFYPRAGLIDTAPAARHEQIAYFHRLGPAGRVTRADRFTAGVQQAAFAGFRQAHPGLTPAAVVQCWLRSTDGHTWPGPLGDQPGAPVTALQPLVMALAAEEIPYAVTGSLAAACWGIPRSCADVDVLIATSPERIGSLLEALRPAYAIANDALAAVPNAGGGLGLLHRPTLVKVDLLLLRPLPGATRPIAVGAGPIGVAFLAPEAWIGQMLAWYQQQGEHNEVTWLDVVGVLQMQRGQLDEAILHREALRQGLAELLAETARAAWELEFGPLPEHKFVRREAPPE